MNKANQTPLEDLRKDALAHYDEAATSIFHHSSEVPKAINFYYDHLIKEEKRRKDFPKLMATQIGVLVVIILASWILARYCL